MVIFQMHFRYCDPPPFSSDCTLSFQVLRPNSSELQACLVGMPLFIILSDISSSRLPLNSFITHAPIFFNQHIISPPHQEGWGPHIKGYSSITRGGYDLCMKSDIL